MDEHRAQLSSAASTLDQLTLRLVTIADAHRQSETDNISSELDEVERSLRSARRKLDRLVRRLA